MLSTPPLAESIGHQSEASPSAIDLVCDITQANPFCESFRSLHVPVLAAFGGGPLHACRLDGSWNLDQAVSENSAALVRSIHNLRTKDDWREWDDLTFQFGPRALLYADLNRVVGYATSAVEANRLVTEFAKAYRIPPEPSGGAFQLIKYGSGHAIECVTVSLPADSILSRKTFDLHYGEGVWGWHEQFIAKLRGSRSGLSILQGPPGTGKTSYLRHLMGVLTETHRFYFIPASAMGMLTEPTFTGFWAEQRRLYDKQNFVVILEDSDAALMSRGSDNREKVNAILNLSDGMLGDFLRLQIISTINCGAADLDPALLRPGRLLCHRVFGRLDYRYAVRLAESLGHQLAMARDYSLAEVYAGKGTLEIERPRIGFVP